MSTAFLEHQQWLESLRVQYCAMQQRTTSGDSPRACPVGGAALSPSPRIACTGASLPPPPMVWALHEEANEGFGTLGLDGLALDVDDFEPPVYRSLGGFAESDWVDVNSVDDEPVYRSLSLSDSESFNETRSMDSEAAGVWLESMPPLLCRQRAGVLA